MDFNFRPFVLKAYCNLYLLKFDILIILITIAIQGKHLINNFKHNLLNFSLLIKANLLLTTILFLVFLTLYPDYSINSFIFTLVASVSTSVTLYLIFYILFFPLSFLGRFPLYLGAFVFIATNIVLVVDFFIFRIWKFHINAMVLNILMSPDAADSIQTGLVPIITAVLIIVVLIAFELYLIKILTNRNKGLNRDLNSKINRKLLPILLLVIVSDKLVDGFANMYAKVEYLEPTKVIPLYQPMDFTGTMEDVFGLKGTTSKKQSLAINANKDLNYPLKPLEINNPNPTNIFIFGIDALRESILSKDVTPFIDELSKTSLVYKNHISGGNATRFGIFSLFYGINSPYWFVFLNAQKGPVFFETLKNMDYQTHIFSSTSTAWPEFRKTTYFDIQDKISDTYAGVPYEKDIQSSDDFITWLDDINSSKPIFSFVFLDAPHGASYPKEDSVFMPDHYGETNFLTVSAKDAPVLLNRYKNSSYFADKMIEKMINSLKEKGLYENSIIIITADHGQEFYEHGLYGHNTSFNYEQVKVPFIIHLPTNEHKTVTRLSSHLDLVPTLLSYIGVENDPSDYSNGYSLFDENYNRKQAYVGNWNNNAILTDDYTYVFSNLPNRIFDDKTYSTEKYIEVEAKNTNRQNVILQVLNENSRFVK